MAKALPRSTMAPMWREHVMIEEEAEMERLREREALAAPLAVKTIQMALFYGVFAICLPVALASMGIGSRHERGLATLGILWLCHLDAASWRPKQARVMGEGARWAASILDLARRRPWWVLALALAPLASGLMALPWGGMGAGAIAARIGQGLFLWVNALGVFSSWGSMIAPGDLAAIEASFPSRGRRVLRAARLGAWSFAFSVLAWTMFCKGAGFM